MPLKEVSTYIHDILKPTLAGFGVSESFTQKILVVVEDQIYSALMHWNDISFRKALLITGAETGDFYMPSTSENIRRFVAVTIRNSPFETIQSINYAVAGLRDNISNEQVKAVTSEAIVYFRRFDFQSLSLKLKAEEYTDVLGNAANKYTVAWTALKALGSARAQVTNYVKPLLTPSLELSEITDDFPEPSKSTIIADGYTASLDDNLRYYFSLIKTKKLNVFFVDSFKTATRNFEKLLLIVEYVLTHGAVFCTSNFYLENGHIEKRMTIVPAIHNTSELTHRLAQTTGLGQKHADVVKQLYAQISFVKEFHVH